VKRQIHVSQIWAISGTVVPVRQTDTKQLATHRKLMNRPRYEETISRLKIIESAGYNVASVWGRESRKQLRDNLGFEQELSWHQLVENTPISIRDALYGGRRDEEFHYVDVISPYPCICKYSKCPIGQPPVSGKSYRLTFYPRRSLITKFPNLL
jgi:hypothetical protein